MAVREPGWLDRVLEEARKCVESQPEYLRGWDIQKQIREIENEKKKGT